MRGWDVYAKSALLLLCAGLITAGLDRSLAARLNNSTLRLAVAFSMVQVSVSIAMAAYLLAQRSYTRFERSISDQLRPAIQENVTAVAFSGQAWPASVPKRGAARRVLEECVATSLLGLRDSGRNQLVHFVQQQGLVKQWQTEFSSRSVSSRRRAIALLRLISGKEGHGKENQEKENQEKENQDLMRRALRDGDPAIRTEAARALLAAGDPAITDMVFRSVLGESLLVRVLLAADLKRHARHLLAGTIPALLTEDANPKTIHCLQILTVWKLAIPGFDMEPLLHGDQSLLPLAISLLPYVSAGAAVEEHLAAALKSSDIEVQCAAAHVAGQLRLIGLTALLVPLLSENRRLAVASATALTQLGPEGARGLQAVIAGSDRKASAAAMEALETSTVGIQ